MDRNDLLCYLALYSVDGIGAKRLLTLVEYFGGAERAFQASRPELERITGLGKVSINSLLKSREEALEFANRQIEKVTEGRAIITYFDPEYPEELKSIYDPPAMLFCEGNIELFTEERKLAVIGTRRITDYGRRVTKEFVETLVANQVLVVSGFARGIDTHAHVAAFEQGGKTIGVLGSGIDVIYPSTNKGFAKEIIQSGRGMIISELPFGSAPDARNFPWRNRIVSGLSKGTFIVESDQQGGSMITASVALDQGRDVFAVPGDITRPMSTGPNYLIRESRAKLVRSAEEIIEELGWLKEQKGKARAKELKNRMDLNLFERKIVEVLEDASVALQIDALAERAEIEVQDLLVHLLTLEFKGVVRQMAGKQFELL